MKVSIVIPVYNAELYLDRCLRSVLGQSYSGIEVIAVDDGSSDESLNILKKYQEKDRRLKVLSQKNLGPNLARLKALNNATGEYVIFVDADDYLSINAVETLVEKLNKYKVQSIRFNAKYCGSGRNVFPILGDGEGDKVIGNNEIMRLLLTSYSLNSLCMQLYETNTVKKCSALREKIIFGEDFLINLEIHEHTERMLVINDTLYFYDDNPTSTTHRKNRERIVGNLSDRVKVSSLALSCMRRRTNSTLCTGAVLYEQLKMIMQSIQKISMIDNYKKRDFVADVNNKLSLEKLPDNEKTCLEKYIMKLSIKERIKNRKIILAIANADYDVIWKYIKLCRAYYIIKGKNKR